MKEYPQFRGSNPFASQAKMLYHLDKLQSYIKDGDTIPIFFEINLSSICNLKCEWCISSNFNRRDVIRTKDLIKFLKEAYDAGVKAVTYSGGGEPTIHKDFSYIVKATKDIGLELGLMTNGVYQTSYNKIIGDNFKWVRFSVDTLIKENYSKWKGLDSVHMVLRNIYALKEYPVKVGINCNVSMEHTIDDITSLTKIMPDAADYIQFRPVLPRYFESEKSDINETVWKWLEKYQTGKDYVNISNDKLDDITYDNMTPFNSCEGHFFNPILDANGNLCICMYHPDDDRFVFGNIYKNTFTEIWNSAKRIEVIEFVRKLNYKDECQMCCKLTELNKFIEFVKNPSNDMDINFL